MVVGLGNPGKKYEATRHNVGFVIVDSLASRAGLAWKKEKKFQAEVARGTHCVFVKPQTYMNLSGRAVQSLCSFYKIPPQAVLVVFDDADLPLGQLRFRLSGSAGGHNGIKSIIQTLGTDKVPRLKVGIGRTEATRDARQKMVGHVLGRFDASEKAEMEKSLARAEDAVNYALSRGLGAAMNQFNEKPKKPKKQPKPKSETKPDTESKSPSQEAAGNGSPVNDQGHEKEI